MIRNVYYDTSSGRLSLCELAQQTLNPQSEVMDAINVAISFLFNPSTGFSPCAHFHKKEHLVSDLNAPTPTSVHRNRLTIRRAIKNIKMITAKSNTVSASEGTKCPIMPAVLFPTCKLHNVELLNFTLDTAYSFMLHLELTLRLGKSQKKEKKKRKWWMKKKWNENDDYFWLKIKMFSVKYQWTTWWTTVDLAAVPEMSIRPESEFLNQCHQLISSNVF